ncbi:MAG: metallophosphoesterase family protein [Candidatus Aenigmarchaeota archaeon]|nr:metallophosphoesterase family protein [Candidatus Aenigmarchaeota archaeon]
MKILAFSDIHGEVGAVKVLTKLVKNNKYDAIIFAGDFSSFHEVQEVYEKTMKELSKLKAPCYYVFGNRDRSFDPFGIGIYVEPEPKYPNLVSDDKIEIGEGICITANPNLVDERTIFLAHRAERFVKEALLHIEGHVHAGIVYKNYINLGFLYRDDFHDEKPGLGCYWEITIESGKIEIEFTGLGLLKPISCPVHKKAKLFIPEEWTVCPLCLEKYYEIDWAQFFRGEEGF